jgi:hypothetical protein
MAAIAPTAPQLTFGFLLLVITYCDFTSEGKSS